MAPEMNQLVEDGSAIRTILDEEYTAALNRKWAALLEGVPNSHARSVTAMLMENQSLHLRGLSEETRQLNVGSFTKFIFPILRRVFPNLIAHDLVSVQPMTGPVGAIFYLDYIYSVTKGGTTAGNVFPRDFDRDFTSEYVNGEIVATADGVNFGGGGGKLNANLAWSPVWPLNESRGLKCVIKELDAATGADVQTATDDGAGGFVFSPAGGATTGQINYANGSVYNFAFQNVPAPGNQIKAYYYYDGEMNTKQPSMSLDVKKKLIEAIPRRIKALWSSEAAEDLRALHGVEAETEMVSAVAQEIGLEIDRGIIDDLFRSSVGTSSSWDRVPPGGISELDHLRSLLTVLSTVSGQVHKKTLRAPANFIVTSPDISALLTQLTTHGDYRPIWVSNPNEGPPMGNVDLPRPMTQHGQFGIYKTGTLMNKWVLYEDPFFTRDFLLLGLKGSTYLDAGYGWAPYIPLQVTATFLDPNDFSFRKGLRTRYGKAMLRPEYYAQVKVMGL